MMVVTGGAGFIGGAVTRRLVELGHEVRVVDDLSKGTVDGLPDGVELVTGDLSEPDVCRRAFAGAHTCFHLAAKIGGIAYFHRYPADILDDNNSMLSQVFRTAAAGAAKIVYVSSSMVFERTTIYPTPESALDRSPPPFSAYGFSKLLGEAYCRAFHEQFGTAFAIARPFNAYGPGEFAEAEPGLAHVIPDLVKKLASGVRPLPIFGDGSQTRSFTYVEDVADAIVTIGTHPAALNDDFNIGTGQETSIRELLGLLWPLFRGADEALEIEELDSLPVDVARRVPDVTKIREKLGWSSSISIEDGLVRTVDWYRARSEHR